MENDKNFVEGVMNSIFRENETNVIVNTTAQPLAWDGIMGCQSFTTPVTVSEAAEAVGANYEVKKHHLLAIPDDLFTAIMNGEPITETTLTIDNLVQSHMATMREDNGNILGVVGRDYGVIQNAKALEFVNMMTSGEIGGAEHPVIETAGILDGGARFYMTAKMPQNICIPGDKFGIEDYIVFTTSHDGSGSVQAFYTPVRVVCRNSLVYAMKTAKNKLIFKHTSRVNERMDWQREENRRTAVNVLKMHEHFKKEFVDDIIKMQNIRIGGDIDITKFCAQLFANEEELNLLAKANYNVDSVEELSTRKRNLIHNMEDTIVSGVGQEEHQKTGLWLLNGVTSFYQNSKVWKAQEDKFDSIMGGDVARKVQRAHDLVLQMA